LVTAAMSRVILFNGATASNVFWQVGSSATLGAQSTFVGTIMANIAISVGDSVEIVGRLLARNAAVTLISDEVSGLGVATANSALLSCPPGLHPTPTGCVVCPIGSWSLVGDPQCTSCPAGQTCPISSVSPAACHPI